MAIAATSGVTAATPGKTWEIQPAALANGCDGAPLLLPNRGDAP
jgi:hypothetical protein